jgi:hypothetical protein
VLPPARTSRARANAGIGQMTRFGIMPAPGEVSVPKGRSPLTDKTSAAMRTRPRPRRGPSQLHESPLHTLPI